MSHLDPQGTIYEASKTRSNMPVDSEYRRCREPRERNIRLGEGASEKPKLILRLGERLNFEGEKGSKQVLEPAYEHLLDTLVLCGVAVLDFRSQNRNV